MFDRITSDPEILAGKPVVRGTRISVEVILEGLGSGASRQDIIARHPHLTTEDIEQATQFAASAFRNDVLLSTEVQA